MPAFSAPDGTELAYHLRGDGAPVVCLPGGPMRDSAYLGDLGGLSAHRRLVMPDHRGTGASAMPQDPASFRCDRLVDDVEALREHLGLDTMDLLGHSAGANIAVLYAARYPHRLSRLALITPGTAAVGLVETGEARLEAALLRKDEPWFATAFPALETLAAGGGTDADWQAVAPFFYGRWDEAAQAQQAASAEHQNAEAARIFGSEGAYDPDSTRAAIAVHPSPVLLFAGSLDLNTGPRITAEYAALFPDAQLVVQTGAGHYPWLDDPGWFAAALAKFLG